MSDNQKSVAFADNPYIAKITSGAEGDTATIAILPSTGMRLPDTKEPAPAYNADKIRNRLRHAEGMEFDRMGSEGELIYRVRPERDKLKALASIVSKFDSMLSLPEKRQMLTGFGLRPNPRSLYD